MTQNIYDDPGFFAGYSRLRRSVEGLDGMPEWPDMRALLPPLQGYGVLDLGCGFGWFARWAAEAGASTVLAVDVSERMLDRARAMTDDPRIVYERADLETLALPEGAFDVAWSALAFHYVADLGRLLRTVRRALAPGSRLVFSMEHPVFTAPRRAGWSVDAEGRRTWPVDGWRDEGPRRTDWLAEGVVKHHRTVGTILNTLIATGFTIRHVDEWGPSPAQVAERPELAEERERPMFLIVAAER